jgi:hypothetical protein
MQQDSLNFLGLVDVITRVTGLSAEQIEAIEAAQISEGDNNP